MPLVQRKQDSIFRGDDRYENRVLCAHKTFIEHGICLEAQVTQVGRQLAWQILVNLELHDALSGSKRSSCANSAAYASDAWTCSGLSDG